jgi:hypothetical protein
MSQATVEAGILATVKLHADFTATNTYLYDKRGLAKGLARFCIISYSSHKTEELTLTTEKRTWTYNVDVLVPWRGELTELDVRVGTETQKVVDTLAKYPRLNATANILKTVLTLSSSPDVITQARGVYRGRRHTLDVQEMFDPGRLE